MFLDVTVPVNKLSLPKAYSSLYPAEYVVFLINNCNIPPMQYLAVNVDGNVVRSSAIATKTYGFVSDINSLFNSYKKSYLSNVEGCAYDAII